MNYLVDTNVLSEVVKPIPGTRVVEWLQRNESKLFVSIISVGEIARGVERLPEGKKKDMLRFWLESICHSMKGRVLSFNLETAHLWGKLKAAWGKNGVIIPSLDAQIAATAHQHQLILATRNTKDFSQAGIRLFDPFL
ncbi:MAG: type II toxin-antitoxin system VapC family toxin [Chthoniobacterales bacterium]|nr:type II toxin-antitoxin system VapC family toxin [Chthoniobacterales bacterium]